jgi:fumarate hydratase class II
MLYNISQSINILSDTCVNFTKYCILGLRVNEKKVKEYVENALTLATILNPYIGYDKATKLAHHAHDKNLSLKKANNELKYLSDADFNKYLRPEKMVYNY